MRGKEFTTEEFTAKDTAAAVAMYTFDFGGEEEEGMHDKNLYRLLDSALDSKEKKKKGSPRRTKG